VLRWKFWARKCLSCSSPNGRYSETSQKITAKTAEKNCKVAKKTLS